MTLDVAANSYGSLEGVAARCSVFTNEGLFDGNTTPKDERVIAWLNEISGYMNIALSNEGFVTPVVQPDAKNMLISAVEQYVADLVFASNSAGRFYTEKFLSSGMTPLMQLMREANDWINVNAGGLENIGVPRRSTPADQIGFREFDESGDPTTPLFQRKAFGNVVRDWDVR